MTRMQKGVAVGLLCLYLAGFPGLLWAQDFQDQTVSVLSQEVIALLKEQNSSLSSDLRRIHREIAALRADLEKPGMRDIFAGIGYIAGLFGMAAFVAARRRSK
jgi:hypothetical protein